MKTNLVANRILSGQRNLRKISKTLEKRLLKLSTDKRIYRSTAIVVGRTIVIPTQFKLLPLIHVYQPSSSSESSNLHLSQFVVDSLELLFVRILEQLSNLTAQAVNLNVVMENYAHHCCYFKAQGGRS